MSHKDSLVLVVASVVDGEVEKQPTSHNDSLVLGVACMAEGEATNESLRLVGAGCGQCGGSGLSSQLLPLFLSIINGSRCGGHRHHHSNSHVVISVV